MRFVLLAAQFVLAARVLWRMARSGRGTRIAATVAEAEVKTGAGDRITVIVPVLDEADRLGPCLARLSKQGPEVIEILVVDGGSRDGTAAVVAEAAISDRRIRWIVAGEAATGWNGKAHNLSVGLAAATPETDWLLTIDADVRPEAALAATLLDFAQREGEAALSVATRQRVSGAAAGLIHPALLTTLVYRFGIPGSATTRVSAVQANGQCMLLRRDALDAVGGFAAVRASLCEDVTLARRLTGRGQRVGFYETEGLVAVEMYAGGRETWRNWPRSLSLRDGVSGWAGWVGLAELALVQAAPLPLAVGLGFFRQKLVPPLSLWWRLNLVLVTVRLGVLIGTARAYEGRPASYWLSPVCDVPAVGAVWLAALRRRHQWRGRTVVRGGSR